MQSLQLQVSLMRLFGRIKATFADAFAVCHNLHTPFSLVRGNTQETRFISFCWFSDILQIAKTRYFSKITKLIVLFVSVFMVYVKQRPLACHVHPRKPMSQFFFVVNCNSPITRVSWAARTFTDKIRAAAMRFPDKFASFWGIVKNRSDMVSGNHEFEFTIKGVK